MAPDGSGPNINDDPMQPHISDNHDGRNPNPNDDPLLVEEEEDDSSHSEDEEEEEEEDESDGSVNCDDEWQEVVERCRKNYKPPLYTGQPLPDGAVVPRHLCTKLSFFTGSHVSIESIDLNIKAGAGAGDSPTHEIFGKIMVTGRRGKVYAVYHREENEPDLVTEGECCSLKLCGPKYALSSTSTEFLHVRLFEKGVDKPFIKGDLLFEYEGHRWGETEELIQMHLLGNWGDVTVNFTRFSDSMPARIRLCPIKEEPHAQWTVSGTVMAIQSRTLPDNGGSFTRTITLFDGKGVQMSSGDVIPLDRSVVVAPIETKDMEGQPGSLTIELKLQFVENDMVSQLNGHRTFVFEEDCVLGERFSKDITLKRTYPSTNGDTPTNCGPDRIQAVVTHFHDFNCDLSDEEEVGDYFDLLATLLR